MKLRLTITAPRPDAVQVDEDGVTLSGMARDVDVTLSCDVTQTVAETARALIRCGVANDREVERLSGSRITPATLIAQAPDASSAVMLDPESPLGVSGLQSGWRIHPVLEFHPPAPTPRVIPASGYVEVISGAHVGAWYSLVEGDNLIGRDRGNRVFLTDHSVSRRHAVVESRHGRLTLRDLGSANGIVVDDQAITELAIDDATEVMLGEISIRIMPSTAKDSPWSSTGMPNTAVDRAAAVPVAPASSLAHRVLHTRAPRVAPRFAESTRELPAPPRPAKPNRIPILAMLAPMMMGGAMFAITQSPMSLMMMAFTPLMMIGSWIDSATGGRRRAKIERREFDAALAAEREELADAQQREVATRRAETPAFDEIVEAITHRGPLLWARRPEHRAFLEVRFGEGTLPSRTELTLPARGDAPRELWESVRDLANENRDVSPVPVLERLDRCGSLGICGPPYRADGLARSLVLQLTGLHSPTELALAAFVGSDDADDWDWLTWLPHVDAVTSPLPCWPLARDALPSLRLVTALEGLLENRRQAGSSRATVRSHLDLDTRNDDAQGSAVTALPTLPVVIALVLHQHNADASRLIALAEDGPDHGIHVIWVASDRADLPAACRTFADLSTTPDETDSTPAETVNFVRSCQSIPLHHLETATVDLARHLARRLAPVEDRAARVLDESDLPGSVNLRDLHAVDLLGGPGAILASWAASDSVAQQWTAGNERHLTSLQAVVGQSADGPAVIDLRHHGPHALVGGTTGSGKSEFLQTWIMSMAARVSPDRLTFLLVDYKGGAAFAECTELPHTVGLVTDLSPHLVRRALTSLRAELRHREELLAHYGAKDVATLERRSEAAAPPTLVIVIDEFAALASEIPEFVDGVIDVAQRGRSLGLHLIMATQRPAGVIKDNLRANTNLRIALRMADESDSSDVVGIKDAAHFAPETPGRGAIKIGAGRISHFQAGYLGGRATTVAMSGLELRTIDFIEGEPWNVPPEPSLDLRGTRRGPGPRDIEALRDAIVEAAQAARLAAPRRPWLDALPRALDLDGVRNTSHAMPGDSPHGGTDAVVVGLRDLPHRQAQDPVAIDFDDSGNVAIVGAGGTGKTTALITLAASLSADAERHPVQIYAINAAGGGLDALSALPTVGAVAPLSDLELVERVLRRVHDAVTERGRRYAESRAGSLTAYRRRSDAAEPRIVLLVDGFAALRQSVEGIGGRLALMTLLTEVMTTGRAVGVHVVLTSDRPSALPAALASAVQLQFVLRLANPHDYGHLSVATGILEEAPAGRAVVAGSVDEVQFACLGGAAEPSEQAIELDRMAAHLRERGVRPAPEVRNAPQRVELSTLPAELDDGAVIGIDTRSLGPAAVPLRGLAVIAGASGSGVSTATRTVINAVRRAAHAHGVSLTTAVLGCERSTLTTELDWDLRAADVESVGERAAELTVALGGRPARRPGEPALAGIGAIGSPIVGAPPAPLRPPAEPLQFPATGARGIIVLERPSLAEGTDAMPQLVALIKAARRAEVLVVAEFDQGGGAPWELLSVLKQPTWGLALQPDEHETQTPFRESFGRVRRADFPPGRGFLVQSGRTVPIQVAVP